jgi:hypothetical protein
MLEICKHFSNMEVPLRPNPAWPRAMLHPRRDVTCTERYGELKDAAALCSGRYGGWQRGLCYVGRDIPHSKSPSTLTIRDYRTSLLSHCVEYIIAPRPTPLSSIYLVPWGVIRKRLFEYFCTSNAPLSSPSRDDHGCTDTPGEAAFCSD